MTKPDNFRVLTIPGWDLQYRKILDEFDYSEKKDQLAAGVLDLVLQRRFPVSKLKKRISGKPVFVVGAGPSLDSAILVLKKYKDTIKICADTALEPLVKNGILPQIVVTDLDGDMDLIAKIANKAIIIVHAHGDNITKLWLAKDFKNCIGTTQSHEVGNIYNFGGFTDGDRCVFLSEFFGAAKIFLFGMDFGPKIGRHSRTKKSDEYLKRKKLRRGKLLLEWFAPKANAQLFTLGKPIKGFQKITYRKLKHTLECI
jgi:uncharacterized Rossmann fold enzyme